MDYEAFDRKVTDTAMRRAFAVDEDLPEPLAALLDRIAACDAPDQDDDTDAPRR